MRKSIQLMTVWCVCTAVTAVAAEREFGFAGHLTKVPDELASTWKIGDPFSGRYRFNAAAPDTLPESSAGSFPLSVSKFNVDLNGIAISSVGPGDVAVYATPGSREYVVTSLTSGPMVAGLAPELQTIDLFGDNLASLENDHLPVSPPSVANFDRSSLYVDFNPSFVRLEGQIDSLYLVPEPVVMNGWWSLSLLLGPLRRRRMTR